MRKPAFCIYENKGADQLHSNLAANQHICFPYTYCTTLYAAYQHLCFSLCNIVQFFYFLNPKFQASSHLQIVSNLVGNPENRVSHEAAKMIFVVSPSKRKWWVLIRCPGIYNVYPCQTLLCILPNPLLLTLSTSVVC